MMALFGLLLGRTINAVIVLGIVALIFIMYAKSVGALD